MAGYFLKHAIFRLCEATSHGPRAYHGKGKAAGKKGKSHVLDFPIIVPRFPVMLILDRRKILLNGPVTAS